MILLQITENGNGVRATDLETHWTTYFGANDGEVLKVDESDKGRIRVNAHYMSGRFSKFRFVASFPSETTIVICETTE